MGFRSPKKGEGEGRKDRVFQSFNGSCCGFFSTGE